MVLGNTFHLFLSPGHELVAAAGRAAPLHALGPAGDHRLRRLPGLLHGPRHGGRRDQGACGPGERAGRDPPDRGGGRALPLLRRRLDAVHGPGDLHGGPGRAGLGHRAGLRRVHRRSTSRASTRRARPSARTAGSTAAWTGTRPTARAGRPSTASCRAGWRRTCAAGVGAGGRARATFGLAIGGSLGQDKAQMYEVVGWTTRGAAGGAPAPPARHRRRGRPAARRRARRRHVRLRDAHAHRPPRHGARARPRAALAGRPRQGRATARRTSRSAPAARAAPARRATRAPICTTCSGSARAPARASSRSTTSPSCSMLMAALRDAVDAGRLAERAARRIRGGAAALATPELADCCPRSGPRSRRTACCDVALHLLLELDAAVRRVARHGEGDRRRGHDDEQQQEREQAPQPGAPRCAGRDGRAAGAGASRALPGARRRRLLDRLEPPRRLSVGGAVRVSGRVASVGSSGRVASVGSATRRRRGGRRAARPRSPSASACSISPASA